MTDFSIWLHKAIAEKKISVNELARQADISPYAIKAILHGKVEGPQLVTVQKIINAMGMHLEIVDEERKRRWLIRK